MRKSRVEKNKELYEELNSEVATNHGLDLESFEIEDISKDATDAFKVENSFSQGEIFLDVQDIEDESDSSEPFLEIHELPEEEPTVPALTNVEFVIEQPVSYNDMLLAEEVLRAKLEKQKELKDSKKGLKRSPVTDTYTAEMMQKNIKHHEGVDVRKELNIKIKKSSMRAIIALSIL